MPGNSQSSSKLFNLIRISRASVWVQPRSCNVGRPDKSTTRVTTNVRRSSPQGSVPLEADDRTARCPRHLIRLVHKHSGTRSSTQFPDPKQRNPFSSGIAIVVAELFTVELPLKIAFDKFEEPIIRDAVRRINPTGKFPRHRWNVVATRLNKSLPNERRAALLLAGCESHAHNSPRVAAFERRLPVEQLRAILYAAPFEETARQVDSKFQFSP